MFSPMASIIQNIIKGEKQNQQSLAVRLTFYLKSTCFGLTKTFFRMMKMIFLATEVQKTVHLMSCDFSNVM